MNLSPIFNTLDKVDSTNNYAMAKVHEGLAKHGEAWFAREQTAGKGQRGKHWYSEPNSSIILSIAIQPGVVFSSNPFLLSAAVAVACKNFLEPLTQNKFFIKWPNDLYWRDRKTGGILIENKYTGSVWSWSVIGIGINVLDQAFRDTGTITPASLQEIAENAQLNAEVLARELQHHILHNLLIPVDRAPLVIGEYNSALYKRGEMVRVKKGNIVFNTRVKEVNMFGQLLTEDNMQRVFNHGEIEWLSVS